MLQIFPFLSIIFLTVNAYPPSQNNDYYSWQSSRNSNTNYRSNDRYDENYFFLNPKSEKVQMNWPDFHRSSHHIHDPHYIAPDFINRNYNRDRTTTYDDRGGGYDRNTG